MLRGLLADQLAQPHQIAAQSAGVGRDGDLADALGKRGQHQFIDQRKALMLHILGQAVDRGEIDAAAVNDDLWDVLPGYLIFRSLVSGRATTARTVANLVDEVVIPGLTRCAR
jgi:hypothetical protein